MREVVVVTGWALVWVLGVPALKFDLPGVVRAVAVHQREQVETR